MVRRVGGTTPPPTLPYFEVRGRVKQRRRAPARLLLQPNRSRATPSEKKSCIRGFQLQHC